MRKNILVLHLFCIPFLLFATHASGAAKLKVVTTLPDLAEVARKVGGDEVSVESFLNGSEDAHFIDASPSFIRKAADADVVCVIGFDLEVGWMPKVLAKSGNAAVQPGGKGYCDTGKGVTPLEKPTGPVDRSMGDVHPFGNPHFNLSPKALAEAASVIAQTLAAVRPENASAFEENKKHFQGDMEKLTARIREKLKALAASAKQTPVAIEYHKEFTYFFDVYGLKSAGSIEDKPGVPPSAARLAQVSESAKQQGVRVAIGSLHSPEQQMRRFEELSGIPARRLPSAVEMNGAANSIEKLQDLLADAILDAAKKPKKP